MKDFTVDAPSFSDKIKITEPTDNNHADNINEGSKQLLGNTMYNKQEIDKLKNEEEKNLKRNAINNGTITSDEGFCIYSPGSSVDEDGYRRTMDSCGMRVNKTKRFLEIYGPTVKVQEPSGSYGQADGMSLRMYGCSSRLLPIRTSDGTSEAMTLGDESNYFGTVYFESKGTPSDCNLKKNIQPLSDERYLELFDKMPLSTFQYRGTNPGMTEPDHSRRHIGVIAQTLQDIISESNIDSMEFSAIKANFFIPNTSDNCISGGWRTSYVDKEEKIVYDYSKNVWNYKHDLAYQVLNEVIEKPISELTFSDYRRNIQYLLIEDNSKVAKEHYQPPVKINSIYLVDKSGEMTKIPLNLGGCCFYESDDKDMQYPLSEGIYDEASDSVTITFDKMYGGYVLKISESGICMKDYDSVLIDVDFIGEYKLYFLPVCDMVNANVWDRNRNPKLIYNYAVDYEQLYLVAMYALQETRKDLVQYKATMDSTIEELKQRLSNLEGGD